MPAGGGGSGPIRERYLDGASSDTEIALSGSAAYAARSSTAKICDYEQEKNDMRISVTPGPRPCGTTSRHEPPMDRRGMVAPFTSDALVTDIQRRVMGTRSDQAVGRPWGIGAKVVMEHINR